MRAAVLEAPRRVRVRAVEPPEPGPGEVRVRLEGCGVCASNLPVYQGREWFDYPLPAGSPGHEGWGVVDGVGPGVRRVGAGDRVALLSERAYAEQDVALEGEIVRLPPALDGQPFPAEPLACAFNVFRRSAVEPGQSVAVVGIGFLGAVLTALSRQAGARVIAVSRRSWALGLGERYGAHHALRVDDRADGHGRVAEQVLALTGRKGCERVLECTGHQSSLDLATRITSVRGRLVVAGYHQDGSRRVDLQTWNWKGLDVINAHERDPAVYARGMREAASAVAAGRLDPGPLLTHRLALEDLPAALDMVAERPDGFLKAWIDPAAGA